MRLLPDTKVPVGIPKARLVKTALIPVRYGIVPEFRISKCVLLRRARRMWQTYNPAVSEHPFTPTNFNP